MSPVFYFLATFFIELIITFAFIRKNFLKTLAYVFLINLFTWPLAMLVFGLYPSLYLVIELFVFLLEGVLLMLLFELKYLRALLISFAANLASMLFGLLM